MKKNSNLERRAAARAALNAPAVPSLIISFLDPVRDAAGNLLRPKPCATNRASVGGVEVYRRPGESIEDFTQRATEELKPSKPEALIFWPAEEGSQ